MALMVVLGILMVVGIALAVAWGSVRYQPWPATTDPGSANDRSTGVPSIEETVRRYLRGVAVALVGGFWAGALVTGPAMRLIMRLLAATAGPEAQGVLTEAEEVVGEIDLDGTIGLYIFGGLLPGLLSGFIYLLVRRWLPAGRAGGLVFGALHLVLAATRIDPLRPDNPDFDIVGPGWLSVATFAVACLLHGMAVVAFANRFSTTFPAATTDRAARVRAALPLVLPALILIPGFPLLLPIAAGLVVALAGSRVEGSSRLVASPAVVLSGRIVLAVAALALLPDTVLDLRDIVVR